MNLCGLEAADSSFAKYSFALKGKLFRHRMRRVEGSGQGPEVDQNPVVEQAQLRVEQKPAAPRSPYSEVYRKEFLEKYPQEKAATDAIFDEIDQQTLDTYESYQSQEFPGVAFSHVKLRVTPDLIRRIRATDPNAAPLPEEGLKPSTAKDQKWFLFTAFAMPPDGDALTVGDLGVDRLMRVLPTVARAMKDGEVPPDAEINLMGAPTGYEGAVTKEWIEAVKKDGFDAYGKLYAEYVKSHVPQDSDKLTNTRIVLQGVSKGTIVADNTFNNLPENIRAQTQELLDNPAGNQFQPGIRYIRGLWVLGTLLAETGVRAGFWKIGDKTMKDLMPKGKPYHEALFRQKGLRLEDSPEQAKLKKSALIEEGKKLIKGSPLDTEDNRIFIRRAIGDPLTFNHERVATLAKMVWRKIRSQTETVSQRLARQEDEFKKEELEALQKEAQTTKMSQDELKARANNIIDRPDHYQVELEQEGQEFPKEKAKETLIARQDGRALEVAIKAKGHFFTLYQDWRRWKKNIDYVKNAIPTPIPQQTAV